MQEIARDLGFILGWIVGMMGIAYIVEVFMKIIVCVDNEYGMMFNNRRQSRDREVIHDIIHNIEGVLWIGEYSKELFVDIL